MDASRRTAMLIWSCIANFASAPEPAAIASYIIRCSASVADFASVAQKLERLYYIKICSSCVYIPIKNRFPEPSRIIR